MAKLNWCPHCKERSMVTKLYNNKKDSNTHRVEYCLNKGCGYKVTLPDLIPVINKQTKQIAYTCLHCS